MRKYEITIFEKDGGKPIYTETVTAKDYNEAFRIVEAHCVAEKGVSYFDFGTKYNRKVKDL